MDKILVYGSALWPQCQPVKEALSHCGIPYEYTDIGSSMKDLKEFLEIRDTSEAHKIVREKHSVGIPCIVVHDRVYIAEQLDVLERILIEEGYL